MGNHNHGAPNNAAAFNRNGNPNIHEHSWNWADTGLGIGGNQHNNAPNNTAGGTSRANR